MDNYTYDEYGHVSSANYIADDDQTTATYESYTNNIIGQVLSKTSKGVVTTAVYDLSGNVIKETFSDGVSTRVLRVVYDSFGRTVHIINDGQYSASSDSINPDSNGISSATAYNDQTVGYRHSYDSNDNVLSVINPANNKTVNTYDAENNLVKTVTYPTISDANNDTNGIVTRYIYDSSGNLTQTIYPHQYVAANDHLDIANGVNSYSQANAGDRAEYDESGNVIKNIDSQGKATVYTYDSNNNIVKFVTGGKVTRLVYNGGEKPVQIIYPDQYNAASDKLDLSAEPAVDSYSNGNVGDRYTYDSNGNVLTHTNPYGKITTNEYDSKGKLLSTTKPDGTVFTYDSETGDILSEMYPNGIENTIEITDFQTVVSGTNGFKTTVSSNALGDVNQYKFENGGATKDYFYTYDSSGNIKTISLNGALLQTFTYNLSNELVRVDDAVAGKSTTYAYDNVGNITKISTHAYTTGSLGSALSSKNYSYNSRNQRTDLNYDARGNLTNLGGYCFDWNDDGRLSGAGSDTNDMYYTYNYQGIRTNKTVNGVTTQFTLDDYNNIVKQIGEINTLEFVYDSNNSPIYLTWNGATYYYEKNLQGDIVGLLDESGNSVVQYEYDIWGAVLSVSGSLADTLGAANPLRYRGYYYDSETELYYLQSRYYSPELMRFISQDDPYYSNSQGQPLGSNLYAYCLNNPVMSSDPTGYLKVSSHWWGLRFTLSNNEAKNLKFGLKAYGWVMGVPAKYLKGVFVKYALWILKGLALVRSEEISRKNKGKGILVDWNWWVVSQVWFGQYWTPLVASIIYSR